MIYRHLYVDAGFLYAYQAFHGNIRANVLKLCEKYAGKGGFLAKKKYFFDTEPNYPTQEQNDKLHKYHTVVKNLFGFNMELGYFIPPSPECPKGLQKGVDVKLAIAWVRDAIAIDVSKTRNVEFWLLSNDSDFSPLVDFAMKRNIQVHLIYAEFGTHALASEYRKLKSSDLHLMQKEHLIECEDKPEKKQSLAQVVRNAKPIEINMKKPGKSLGALKDLMALKS